MASSRSKPTHHANLETPQIEKRPFKPLKVLLGHRHFSFEEGGIVWQIEISMGTAIAAMSARESILLYCNIRAATGLNKA